MADVASIVPTTYAIKFRRGNFLIAIFSARSALETRARWVIAAVNLRVAILARASDDTRIHRQCCRWCGRPQRTIAQCRLPGLKQLSRVAIGDVMALLAQKRTRGLQQLIVIRSVWIVASHAIFAHGRVFPDKRPALFGVTLIAGVVDRIRFQQRFRGRAVRIVAIDAGNFSFRQRHMRALVEFGALLLMAGLAGFVNARFFQQSVGRKPRHRIVAIAARELIVFVRGTGPMQSLRTNVAVHAHAILLFDRRAPLFGKANQKMSVLEIGRHNVFGARPVAGFAHFFLVVVARVLPEHFGVHGVREVFAFGYVAAEAYFFANIGCVGHRVNHAGGRLGVRRCS